MSSFTDRLFVEIEQGERGGRGLAVLTQHFSYDVGFLGSGVTITVPATFETDFCSIPRVLMPLFPVMGRAAKAGVLHDWMVSAKNPDPVDWRRAARIFREAMGVLGVPPARRWLMWAGVRLWGMVRR